MMKAWEAKATKRAANATGFTLMAVSLAACNDDAATPAAGGTPPGTPPAVTGVNFTVSPDTFSFSGVANAARAYTPGGNDLVNTLQSDDVVTGTGTADVLNVTFGNSNDAGVATVAPTLTGIETINFANVGSNGAVDTLDMSNVTGVTALNMSSLTDDTIIRGLDTVSVALKAFNVSDEATDIAFEFDDTAVAGTSDTVSITVDNFNGNNINFGSAATEAANGAGVETLNLVASGAASTIANLGSTGLTVINVDADAALTVAAIAATGVTTLNLTGSTATTSFNVGANVGPNEFTYTGGAGNDTLIMSTGFTGTDVLNAGAGSDTLSIRPGAQAATVITVGDLNSADAAVATNWETLDLRSPDNAAAGAIDFTVDMDHLPGVTAISMRAGDVNDNTIFTLNDLTQAQAGALTMTHTGTVAATDSEIIVDMKTNGTDTVKLSATVSADTQVVELNDANDNIENAEITLSGAFTTNLDVDVTSFLTSLTVSGGVADESLEITNAHTSATVNMANVLSDVTMTLGAGTQTVTTGAGDDAITLAAGVKTVNTGAGDDTVTTTIAGLGTTTATTDTINGGAGTDTLAFTEIDNITAAMVQGVSNFERLSFTDAAAGASTVNMALFSGIERITVGDTNDALLTFSNVAASFADLRFVDSADNDTNVALNRLVDGTADAITVSVAGAGAPSIDVLTLNDEETITLTTSGTGAVTFADINAADLKALVVTGSNAVTASDISSTALANVDASSATGNVTVSGANSGVSITATGNAVAGGVFTFTGGTGADIITGGIGADVLVGGLGADTITGGEGADHITGGAGVDRIVLTETIAAADEVELSIGAANYDQIVGFKAGGAASDDNLSALQATFGWTSTDGATTVILSSGVSLKAADAAADSTVITISTNVSGGTFAAFMAGTMSEAVMEGHVITALGLTGALDAAAVIMVLVDDGTHTGVFSFTGGDAGTDDAVAADEIQIMSVLEGVSDATTILAGDILFT